MELKGLNKQEVDDRISKGLQNKSSKPKTKTISEIFIENIFSVFNMIILAIIIFVLYFYLRTRDDRLLLDSIGILFIAFMNTFLAIYQEIKAKKALDKVNLLLKKQVIVIREETELSIEPSEIVLNDLIKIQRGDQVVVDGRVKYSNHLEIDESLLTGESNPIQKKEHDEILSGSFCLSGNGVYEAEKIGDDSYAAQVTSQAKKYKFDLTPLQRKINFIVKTLFAVAVLLVILEIIINKEGFNADFVRKIATIMISLVPQGLVLMSTVTFAVGVYRISKLGAIIQRLNAIESFSNVKVVCMDKTGTLTQNKLSIYRITLPENSNNIEAVKTLIGTYAKLTSDKNATINAINVYPADDKIVLVDEYPFSSEKKMSMLETKNGTQNTTFVLGAYDLLTERMSDPFKDQFKNIFERDELSIYRNVLLGKAASGKPIEELKENLDFQIEPICIISITDKIRDDVLEAIKLFEDNDIKIKILSGDSAKAIQEVTNEIGWKVKDSDMISGQDLDNTKDEDFTDVVLKNTIFARLKPEHKLKIIKTLKKEKIYTAMIGDGVNDLPAIKEANMGIAMEEGSSITKEVGDIILLKNKFSLLPSIFNEGNKIINTVKSVGKLFITKNFFVIYIALMSLFFLLDFPLTPRRVSFINIFGIGLPAFMITLKNMNTEKTRDFMKDLFSFVIISALIIVAAGYIGIYIVQQYYEVNERDLQMVMLTIMIITNIANYFSIVLKKNSGNNLIYLIYGIFILIIYIFFAATSIDFLIINWIKSFYEIYFIKPELWPVIIIISLISSFLLIAAQKLREKIILKQ